MPASPFASTSLQIRDYQGLVVLGNAVGGEFDTSPQNPVLYGDLVLSLPGERQISSIVVRHVVRYEASNSSRREASVIRLTETRLNTRCIALSRGEHTLPWKIQLPAGTPAGICASPLGRVTHSLEAQVSCLRGHGDICAQKPLRVVGSMSSDSPSNTQSMRGMVDAVGPYSVELKSSSLTIGGYLEFGFHLVSPPTTIRVRSIRAKIFQTLTSDTLNTTGEPTVHRFPPVEFMRIGSLSPRTTPQAGALPPETVVTSLPQPRDPNLLAVFGVGEELHLDYLARLPSDEKLLPSTTSAKANSPVRVSHVIGVDIQYSTPEDQRELVVRLTQQLSISSCGCVPESTLLPAYSPARCPQREPLHHAMAKLMKQTPRCVCRMTWDELLGQRYNVVCQKLDIPPSKLC